MWPAGRIAAAAWQQPGGGDMVAQIQRSPSVALLARRGPTVVALVLGLLAIALLPGPARAQAARDSNVCARASTAPPEHEARVAACSRVLAASRAQATRAAAYHS